MNQDQYMMIIRCVQFGMPAIADELIMSLNSTISKLKSYEKQEKKCTKESKETK